jgi:hypothetical protein
MVLTNGSSDDIFVRCYMILLGTVPSKAKNMGDRLICRSSLLVASWNGQEFFMGCDHGDIILSLLLFSITITTI